MSFGQYQPKRKSQRQSLKEADRNLDALSAARRAFLTIAKAFLLLVSAGALYVVICVYLELAKVPDFTYLNNYHPVSYVQIYDRNDKLIASIEGAEKRTIIPLSQVTSHLQRAVLTAEDRHFYDHHGIDPLGISRAILINILAGHAVQGGSTITQQLAKNLFFEDSKRTLITKIAEAIASNRLEDHFSKEKILELYLNEVYFGNGAYGIEQAANLYFDKDASQLTIAESAYIAGLIRWPSRGGQAFYRQDNINRQHDVLNKMYEYGYISQDQLAQAKDQELIFKARPQKRSICPIPRYRYYISYVLEQVHGMYTEGQMQRHGLKVYTNLDQAAQQTAERILSSGIQRAPRGVTQGALVSINVRDGAVLSLVGGVGNYMDNQWNCATNPHTIGSAIKPFIYLTAFNRGLLTPESMISDSPITIAQDHQPDYKPKNYDGKYMGNISVAEALAYSRNTCAIRAAQKVGIEAVIRTAHQAGIKASMPAQISTALGASAASPLDMANAYGTIARGGVYIAPSFIRRIDNKNGINLQVFQESPQRVFDTKPVALLVDVLQEVVAQGTGTLARLSDRPVAGKTGTADQAKDLWFVGFTPDLVTAVWAGNDDNHAIAGAHVSGGTVMAGIWRDYNRGYYAKHDVPNSWFVACNHLSGNFKFPQRQSKTMADDNSPATKAGNKTLTNSNHKPAQALVVPLWYYESDAGGYGSRGRRSYRRHTDSTTSKSNSGVAEYRW